MTYTPPPMDFDVEIGPSEPDWGCDVCAWADAGQYRLLALVQVRELSSVGTTRGVTRYCEEHFLAWIRKKGYDESADSEAEGYDPAG